MIIAKKYRSNSVKKWRAQCGMLPSNIARKQKITSRPFFLKAQTSVLSLKA